MGESVIGARIRAGRQAARLTQTALADAVGVSTSYINLIESGKRSVGGALLSRIARRLDVQLTSLDDIEARRLAGALAEIAADPLVRDTQADPAAAGDIVGRHPNWAEAILRLHRAFAARDRAATALADRLNQDPILAAGVYRMISHVSAIRSAAEILQEAGDMTDRQVSRFHQMLSQESAKLSEVSQDLANFFRTAEAQRAATVPSEEVDDFVAARQNYFPTLEAAADAFRGEAGLHDDAAGEAPIAAWIERRLGLQVRLADASEPSEPAEGGFSRGLSARYGQGLLLVDAATPIARRRFELARFALAETAREAINEIVSEDSKLRSHPARQRAVGALASYAAAAALMPYDSFYEEAERRRYDLEALAHRYAASVEQVAHRAATLRRPGSEGVPFGFMRVDPSGFVTKRLALPGLPLPRLGGACPLWAVYRAFQTPGRVVAQRASFAGGETFLFVARTQEKGGGGAPRSTRHLVSIQLACEAIHADRLLYSDDVGGAASDPVGATCRLCARANCPARQEELVAAP